MIKIKAGTLNIHDAFNGLYLYGTLAEDIYEDEYLVSKAGTEVYVHAMGTEPYIGDPNDDPDLPEAYGFEIVQEV